ncbi:hypothetical protein MINTM008_23900 [Mycobacterium intracellulare]|nr:hypothetical protein MINTM005_22410 [Mycobacterium intracellulare]BCO73055.1 hypothetical protein MINTM008_23900 [Mycobacterium intracellulare]BCO78496.1 hypothetical protein MINTM009_22780 [Mycobacterium intracellulare]BCO94101.1 hypothetical protein MINTM016_20770 [Mycobacterium intracellulare]BCP31473.1 hypothetical protein MINTM026_24430 [Mycobacterium intracellulare]
MAILSATSGVFIKSLALGRPIVAGEKIDGTAKRKFLQWFWDLCVPHGLPGLRQNISDVYGQKNSRWQKWAALNDTCI